MPGLHIYCVMPGDCAPPRQLRGIDDAAVFAVATTGVAVWASAYERRPAANPACASAHNRVVEAGMNTEVTPVPVRYGQWFDSERAAAAALAAESERWTTLLRHFAGRCEWGVRIMGVGPAREMHPARAESGTAYMVELARRKARTDDRRSAGARVAEQVALRIGALAVDTRVEVQAGGDVMNLCPLVAWNDAAAYHTHVRSVRDEHRSLRFLFTGPWPPYSFVE
jgi:hypothetical protein